MNREDFLPQRGSGINSEKNTLSSNPLPSRERKIKEKVQLS